MPAPQCHQSLTALQETGAAKGGEAGEQEDAVCCSVPVPLVLQTRRSAAADLACCKHAHTVPGLLTRHLPPLHAGLGLVLAPALPPLVHASQGLALALVLVLVLVLALALALVRVPVPA